MNWLQRLLSKPEKPRTEQGKPAAGPQAPAPPARPGGTGALDVSAVMDSRIDAEKHLREVQEKTNKLAEDFARGEVNRATFIHLYQHYQQQRSAIERMLEISPEKWRQAVSQGVSIAIRREHHAKALGFSIYESASGMPISTLGKFDLDPALMVPMLSQYREATREIFGSRMRSGQIESGRWLCFVSGQFTTLIALYNTEPAARQLQLLEETHLFFERANKPRLQQSPISAEGLVFPHEYYLQ
ncbi:MAG: hypothetical protein JW929_09610 [Anaerolineales bacterium]|nr:hypothetical protein [Anaerolineales bacterium]